MIDFLRLTKKDVFTLLLKGDHLNFGFIPKWHRRKFVRFLIDNRLLVKYPGSSKEWNTYVVKHSFSYSATVSQLDGLPGSLLLEWLSDLCQHRHWTIFTDFFYTSYVNYHLAPDPYTDPRFDYVIIMDDLIYD